MLLAKRSDRLYSCRWCWLWISVSFVALLCLVVTDKWRCRRMPRLRVSSNDDVVYVVKKNELRWLANAYRQITTHANPKIKPLTIIGRWCASIIICTFVSVYKVHKVQGTLQKFLQGILSPQNLFTIVWCWKFCSGACTCFFSSPVHSIRFTITHTLIS